MPYSVWKYIGILIVLLTAMFVFCNEKREANRPPPVYCGKRLTRSEHVTGTNAWPGKWPWLVSTEDGMRCGTLISRYWVLSAATCDINAGDVLVLGMFSVSAGRDGEPHRRYVKVCKSIVHQNFNQDTLVNNIRMIKLARPVRRWCKYVQPCCLPVKPLDTNVTNKLVVAGWKSGDADLLNDSQASIPAACPFAINLDLQFCTDSRCVGSEGSGAYVLDGERWRIVGVFSSHNTACKYGYSAVYYYNTWIRDLTERD
jgi:hypothetical protein